MSAVDGSLHAGGRRVVRILFDADIADPEVRIVLVQSFPLVAHEIEFRDAECHILVGFPDPDSDCFDIREGRIADLPRMFLDGNSNLVPVVRSAARHVLPEFRARGVKSQFIFKIAVGPIHHVVRVKILCVGELSIFRDPNLIAIGST